MKFPVPVAALLACAVSNAAIIDRVSVIVGKRPILASAIDRDIRVTSFLNGNRPDFSPASRKQAASRLIDQQLIRDQIRGGDYPVAPEDEADRLLEQTARDRYANNAQLRQALQRAGITEAELKDRLLWQLTVLRFIDARFRPAVVVSNEEVERYYTAHRTQLNAPLDQVRQKITDDLTGERVNGLLDDWLRQQRRDTRVEYLEKSLQ